MNTENKRPYRYERKFIVERMEPAQVCALIKLHPSLFREPYPARFINNIYLDTPEMDYYYENISGVKNRRKARIRWYGDLFGLISRPTLEFKVKDGVVGTKVSYPLPSFTLDPTFTSRDYAHLVLNAAIPPEVSYSLRDHAPVLVNRYYRWYYATVDGRFRVTVDTALDYYNIRSLHNPFLYRHRNHTHFIVELKYDPEFDPDANRVAHHFPFSLTKNSKYVEGIEKVFH